MNDKATKQGVEDEGGGGGEERGGRRERWGSESFLRSLQGFEQTQMVWRDDISRPEAPLEAESLHTEGRVKPENSEEEGRLGCLVTTVQRDAGTPQKHTACVTGIKVSVTLNSKEPFFSSVRMIN